MVESVYCAVRTDSLYKADYISSLKRLIQTKRRLGLLDLEGGGRKVLSSEGNDLPIDTASGFGKIASLENTVKVFRPYKTYLKRCKRSVSPTGRNCNTKLHFALLTPLFKTLPSFKGKFSTWVPVLQDIYICLSLTVQTVFMILVSNKIKSQ